VGAMGRILVVAVAFAIAGTANAAVSATFKPTKPVRFIVPVGAGGSADIAARAIAQQLARVWQQPVVVDNRPGAGTIVGTAALAGAAPDAHTFGWVIAAHAINPSLYPKLPYNTTRDFAGVTLVYQLRIVLLASNHAPFSSVDMLVAHAKSRPGALLYTSPGPGTGPHLIGELFKLKYGVQMTHVAYKSGPSAHPDVIAGRVPLMFDTLPTALPLVAGGKLKALAVLGDTAAAALPSVPALPGLLPANATTGWNGIVVPAATPRTDIAKLNADIVTALRSREVEERLAALNVDVITSSPTEFDAFIREDIARWADVVKRAGITLE